MCIMKACNPICYFIQSEDRLLKKIISSNIQFSRRRHTFSLSSNGSVLRIKLLRHSVETIREKGTEIKPTRSNSDRLAEIRISRILTMQMHDIALNATLLKNKLLQDDLAQSDLLRRRLYTLTTMARTHDLVPKWFLRSSDWLMRSELGYALRVVLFQT